MFENSIEQHAICQMHSKCVLEEDPSGAYLMNIKRNN